MSLEVVKSVREESVSVGQDAAGIVGKQLGRPVAVDFPGKPAPEKRVAGEALPERRGEIAAPTEIITREAGGIRIPREPGCEQRLRLARGAHAIADVSHDGVPDMLQAG